MRANIALAHHKSFAERSAAVDTCVREMEIDFPALVDEMDNSTELAYTAWPDRLYVIDRNGRIAYKSRPGPFGFKPDGVREALNELLPDPEHQAESESTPEGDTAAAQSASVEHL